MKVALIVFILLGFALIGLLSLELKICQDCYDEPTHTMSQEQMEQICREEGIPLDY